MTVQELIEELTRLKDAGFGETELVLSVTQELGTNRGSWSAGITYNARDIVKDSSNNNVYLCNTTHTSTGTTPISSNADVAKWDLIVEPLITLFL